MVSVTALPCKILITTFVIFTVILVHRKWKILISNTIRASKWNSTTDVRNAILAICPSLLSSQFHYVSPVDHAKHRGVPTVTTSTTTMLRRRWSSFKQIQSSQLPVILIDNRRKCHFTPASRVSRHPVIVPALYQDTRHLAVAAAAAAVADAAEFNIG